MTTQGVPPMWNSYITVDDVDATIDRWTGAGDTVMMPTMDAPSGRISVVSDPQGGTFSLIPPPQQA